MNEPIVQANRNLLFNGDFSEGTDGWKKSGPSIGVAGDWYAGDRILLLHLSHESYVSQEFEVPRKTASDAQYRLSFLCETIHEQSGWLYLFKGSEEILKVELKPATGRNLEEDLARLAVGQPLDFVPIEYEQTLNSSFDAGDTLRIEIKSPPNDDDDYSSKVRITRINLLLHLAPLKLRTMKLDDQVLDEGSTLCFCLGATDANPHSLTFEPEPEHAWENTEAALTLTDNPQQAIVVKPGPEVEQLLTEQWSLDCPVVGDEDPYSFTLNLINRYNAEPFTIPVSLGHHRLKFRERLEAAYYPVLEYQQSVRLGVRVASFYTQQSVAGVTVNWSTAERVTAASVSDEYGWAYFDFQPTVAVEALIEASVGSPYYSSGVYTEQFNVRVLATDPWKDLRAVVDEVETAWDANGYPNRGSTHDLLVRLPDNSPLLDTELSLHWSGDSHEQLGVDVSPPLEDPVQVARPDMLWTLTCDDELDGRFLLSLVCSKLLLPSPGKPMSLARNRVRVGEVHEANKFPVVDEQESVLLRVQVLHETASADGDPVRNALVEWHTPEDVITTYTGYGGWANVFYTPLRAGDLKVIAHVKAHPEAVPITREFEVTAIATSPWKTEVEIRLDGEIIQRNTLGLVCKKGLPHTLSVVPVAGSSWIGKGISLQWRNDDPADIGLQFSEPGVSKPLTAEGVRWTLSSAAEGSISSLFELELRLQSVEIVRELSGRLLSADLSTEVSLLLDQIRAAPDEQAHYPCLGATHRFNVLPNELSPLVGLQAALSWSGTSMDDLDASVRPSLDTSQTLNDGGTIWELDFSASEQPGRFALTLALPELDYVAQGKPMVLGHNKVKIHAVREATVDPVVGQTPAWLWVQVYSHFTDRAVGRVPVKWWDGLDGATTLTDAEGWSGFGFRPDTGDMHSVTALVESYFDNFEDARTIAVKAQLTDPWTELWVSFDNKPAQLWGEKTCFPRRKGQHRIDVKAAANSALLDCSLALGMTGNGPEELGIRFDGPMLGEFQRFTEEGLTYLYSAGDLKNGRFGLCFACERLANLSPVNAMSLGEGAQVVKIAERSRGSQTLLWGEAVSEQITVVSAISGRPMAGMNVVWRSADLGEVTTTTNFYGEARIRFVPKTPGAAQLTATVGDAQYSESISLPYFLHEPRQIKELFSDDLTGYPGQEISAQALVVSANTGEPLANVEVMWEYNNTSLPATLTGTDGMATVRFVLGTASEAALWASVKGGLAGWDVETLRLTVTERPAVVKSVVAAPNPAFVNDWVTMTALIVDKASGEPMPKRKILVSINGRPFIDSSTNGNGKYETAWRVVELSETVSLDVKVENPDGTSSSGFVLVRIER
ncbi:Ig-like domain-containing protein [Pseudomonas sp. Irchel s3h9]|uniref:Ig-like domain-containing protein n=1 Tax=Pseudomonas sp. Irchel s3h9 TaxID=2009192 RepID=UPI000BA4161A|nr:Ig-like domain-containing protein [Pseudomonas sp. Irchel s3h9]